MGRRPVFCAGRTLKRRLNESENPTENRKQLLKTPNDRETCSSRSSIAILTMGVSLSAAADVQNELIVKLRVPPQRSPLDEIRTTGVSVLDSLSAVSAVHLWSPFAGLHQRFSQVAPVILMRVGAGINFDSLQYALAREPGVDWVSRNHVFHAEFVPNDSMYGEKWWLQRVSAPLAWDISRGDYATGDSAVIIGIVDTGVDYKHPDLISKIWVNQGDANQNGIDDDDNGFVDDSIGWDFVDAPALPSDGDYLVRDRDPKDEMGHGTYVSGIAAGATNNSLCVSSIGFNCRIMCLRAGNADGYLQETDIAAAILYGVENGARVINMSFGDKVASPLLREVCTIAGQAGIVLVASAGNDRTDSIHYPSGFPEVISVGATNQYDLKAGFSDFGPSVDVFAPGDSIQSTVFENDGERCGYWRLPSGTSYSAPMVSGLAGLVIAVNPALTPEDVKEVIVTTADDLEQPGWDPRTTHGRINARRAVEQAAHGADVIARLISPPQDQGFAADFAVTGEAWGADFNSWTLSFGFGETPLTWTLVASDSSRVYGDTLGVIQIPVADTTLVVRLMTVGNSGAYSVDHRHYFIQHGVPTIDSLRVRTMLDQDSYGKLVEEWGTQTTVGSVIAVNLSGDSTREDFGYVAEDHTGFLAQRNYPGSWTVRVRVENRAGVSAWSSPFEFGFTQLPFSSNIWTASPTNLPDGYMGSFVTDSTIKTDVQKFG